MSNTLIQAVHDFLDAEMMLEQRRCEIGNAAPERRAFQDAKRRLNEALDAASPDSVERPLVVEVQAYLAAVDYFEKAREANSPQLSRAARALESAQQELEVMLNRCEAELYDSTSSPPPQQKRLLVAIDGSQASEWATDVAVNLAAALNAAIRLLYVETPYPNDNLESPLMLEEIRELHCNRAHAILNAAQARVPADIPCSTMQLYGEPATMIVNTARRLRPDFIVMGTRGHGRLTRFLLGSTAQSVIRLAACPVITVSHAPVGTANEMDHKASTPQLAARS